MSAQLPVMAATTFEGMALANGGRSVVLRFGAEHGVIGIEVPREALALLAYSALSSAPEDPDLTAAA